VSDAPTTPCGTCGICCRSYVVPVNGYDIWLISTRERLNPEEFIVAYPLPKKNAESFHLSKDGFNCALALAKKGEFAIERDCTFLVQLGGGHARCGIYEHRPGACRTYPMTLFRNAVIQRKDSRCPPNAWSEEAKRWPSWRVSLKRMDMTFDVYHEVVARWNARVDQSPEGTTYPLTTYLNYLMNVYDRLGQLDAQLGEEALARVRENWAALPEHGDLSDESVNHDQYPWVTYLSAAREIIDEFYPDVASQVSIALLRATANQGTDPPRHLIPDDVWEAAGAKG